MVKISKSQLQMLRRLNAGEILTVSTGRYYRASFHSGDQTGQDPRTISALQRAGMVQSRHWGAPLSVGSRQIVITDAGRAAITGT